MCGTRRRRNAQNCLRTDISNASGQYIGIYCPPGNIQGIYCPPGNIYLYIARTERSICFILQNMPVLFKHEILQNIFSSYNKYIYIYAYNDDYTYSNISRSCKIINMPTRKWLFTIDIYQINVYLLIQTSRDMESAIRPIKVIKRSGETIQFSFIVEDE